MRTDAAGTVLFDGDQVVDEDRLKKLADALDSDSSAQTALLVPFFGPTVGGEHTVVDPAGLGLDLTALLVGVSYEWKRHFVANETTHVRVIVEQTYIKSSNTFGIVATEFTDQAGNVIQRQTATFIERGDQ